MSNQQKKNTSYGAAAILTASTILVKIIDVVFKIPLIAILPGETYDDFNGAYNIHSFFLTISATGLPAALSKAASECHTLGRENQKHWVSRVIFYAFLFMGLFSFLCMSVFGQLIATYITDSEEAVFYVWALAPVALYACCCSAFRGCAQRHMNMISVAISQIIKVLCKFLLGLGLVMMIMSLTLRPEDIHNRLAAFGVLIGVPFDSVPSVIYLVFDRFRTYRGSVVRVAGQSDWNRMVLTRLPKLAIPITLSSCSMFLMTIIDTNLVSNQLQNVFAVVQDDMTGISNSFLDISLRTVGIFWNNMDAWQQALLTDPAAKLNPILDSARSLCGAYSRAMSVYDLSFSLMAPLTVYTVPGISACLARNDRLGTKRITESAMRVAALIALPCGFGLLALGDPIVEFIALGNADTTVTGLVLSILGIASILVCFQLVDTVILQANGIMNLSIITIIIGGVTKVLVNCALVGNPKTVIFGAPVGTLSCFAVISILDLLTIKRCAPNPPRYLMALSKPLAVSVVMVAAVWGSHGLLARVLNDGLIRDMAATIGAIPVSVVVYVTLVPVLRTLTRGDLEVMPGDKKLTKILHIQ